MQPQHHFVTCLDLEIHYTSWGNPQLPAVIAWHGLTRTGRDFDELASALAKDYFVICPDTPGRGLSQWSNTPEITYTVPFYAKLALDLLDQWQIESCYWVGTSMGGLIGMVVAAIAPGRIQRMVLNDIGPEVPLAAVERIRDYAGLQPEFNALGELEAWLRQVYVPFGENTDVFWQRMARTSARRTDAGKITLHYDPRLVIPFQHYDGATLWDLWPLLSCPILVLRGEYSDVLLPEHLERMLQENQSAQAITIPKVAHAPTLANAQQIQQVAAFLGSA